MKNNKKVLIVSIIGIMVFFFLLIGFIGQGNVRHVPIFFKEKPIGKIKAVKVGTID